MSTNLAVGTDSLNHANIGLAHFCVEGRFGNLETHTILCSTSEYGKLKKETPPTQRQADMNFLDKLKHKVKKIIITVVEQLTSMKFYFAVFKILFYLFLILISLFLD